MSWWTTEQVAEYLDVSPQAIYDSRARGKFPGNRGQRLGKRLRFASEAIEEGRRAVEAGEDPDSRETTNDVNTAILWQLQGIEAKLGIVITLLQRQETLAHGTFEQWELTQEGHEEE